MGWTTEQAEGLFPVIFLTLMLLPCRGDPVLPPLQSEPNQPLPAGTATHAHPYPSHSPSSLALPLSGPRAPPCTKMADSRASLHRGPLLATLFALGYSILSLSYAHKRAPSWRAGYSAGVGQEVGAHLKALHFRQTPWQGPWYSSEDHTSEK